MVEIKLKKSDIGASTDYTFFEIPNTKKVMVASYKDNYLTLVGWDDRGMWFRLGDRPDLKPKQLKDFNCCLDSTDKKERELFINNVIETFK